MGVTKAGRNLVGSAGPQLGLFDEPMALRRRPAVFRHPDARRDIRLGEHVVGLRCGSAPAQHRLRRRDRGPPWPLPRWVGRGDIDAALREVGLDSEEARRAARPRRAVACGAHRVARRRDDQLHRPAARARARSARRRRGALSRRGAAATRGCSSNCRRRRAPSRSATWCRAGCSAGAAHLWQTLRAFRGHNWA